MVVREGREAEEAGRQQQKADEEREEEERREEMVRGEEGGYMAERVEVEGRGCGAKAGREKATGKNAAGWGK